MKITLYGKEFEVPASQDTYQALRERYADDLEKHVEGISGALANWNGEGEGLFVRIAESFPPALSWHLVAIFELAGWKAVPAYQMRVENTGLFFWLIGKPDKTNLERQGFHLRLE